jgi:hypothetical protein
MSYSIFEVYIHKSPCFFLRRKILLSHRSENGRRIQHRHGQRKSCFGLEIWFVVVAHIVELRGSLDMSRNDRERKETDIHMNLG